jgi:hypothetical protein
MAWLIDDHNFLLLELVGTGVVVVVVVLAAATYH